MSKASSRQNQVRTGSTPVIGDSTETDQKPVTKKTDAGSVDIETLSEDYIRRYRAGESPSITEYADQYPHLESEIRECFPAIAALEGMKAYDSPEGKISLGGSQPKQLGDFRIVREIGRGGMGVVYEAIQESLNRPVALKVLPRHSLLEPKQLKRFEKEAKIAASLHHTNIVPVFGVGENDGYHYYVMQLNKGVGLDELLHRTSDTLADSKFHKHKTVTRLTDELLNDTDNFSQVDTSNIRKNSDQFPWAKFIRLIDTPDDIARIGIQSAKALHYAHERGILHRDIKPGNLLIDQDGIVRVTDFGLARAFEHDNQSMSEEIVGTLGYMAPETLEGETIPQSDIYSLGITLYELLTKQVAFERSERSHIIDRIRSGSIKPPRSLNPDIPRDLETIVLKAISVNPKHRYQTAKQLEDDLKLFLEDRPIRARRVTAAERLWRWSRRNPVVAALSGLAVILLMTIGVVLSLGYQSELKLRKQAEQSSSLATESLDRLFNRFVPGRFQSSMRVISDDPDLNTISSQPVLSKESALILTEMIGFYEELASQTGEKKEFQLKTANARRKVGDIHHRLGDFESAINSYQKALNSYQTLITSEKSIDPGLMIDKSIIQNEMGLLFRKTGQREKGNQFHQNALASLNKISASDELKNLVQFEVARTYFLMGQKLRPELKNDPEDLDERHPEDGHFGPQGPDRHHERKGRPPHEQGDDVAGNHHRPPRHGPPGKRPPRRKNDDEDGHQPGFGHGEDQEGRPPRDQAGRDRKRPPRHQGRPNRGPNGEGPKKPRNPEDLENLNKAILILENLIKSDPQNAEYQYLLALCLEEQLPDTFNKTEEEKETENSVIAILTDLIERHPHVADYRLALVNTYEKVDVKNEPAESMTDELVKQLKQAIPHAQKLVSDFPTIPNYKITLIHAHNKLATVLEYLMWELPDEQAWQTLNTAEQSRRTSLRLQRELVLQFPDSREHQHWLAKFLVSVASIITERENYEEAVLLLEEAEGMLTEVVEKDPNNRQAAHELGKVYHLLADIYEMKDYHDLSREYREKVRELRPQRPERRKPPFEQEET